jgi:uncharacterized membrane protein YfcA
MTEILFNNYFIIFLFFIVAILYSSVGFGGGSSYLAILALTSLAFTQIRATALLCNIVVVCGNVFIYYQKKELNIPKILPLVLLSTGKTTTKEIKLFIKYSFCLFRRLFKN